MRTWITRAPCRKRTGAAVPRGEKFGDMITAGHKVLSEGCESRNNHRYAVVVQALATQMDSSMFVQNKNFTGNSKKLAKVLGARQEAKSHLLWNSADFVKISLGIIARLHHTDQKQMGLLKEQCAE